MADYGSQELGIEELVTIAMEKERLYKINIKRKVKNI